MSRRPSFIPRDSFRQWMSPSRLDKFFQVGAILASSFVQRREALGRPVRRSARGWVRPLDVVAAAAADGLPINPPRERRPERMRLGRPDLERERQKLEMVLGGPSAFKRHDFYDNLVVTLTRRRMASREEILEHSAPIETAASGVYFLISGDEIVYVGQSRNVHARIASHMTTKTFDRVAVLRVAPDQLDFVESVYILALKPRLNGQPPRNLAQLAEVAALLPLEGAA